MLEKQYSAQTHQKLIQQFEDIQKQLEQCKQVPQYKTMQQERQVTVNTLCKSLKKIEQEQTKATQELQKQAAVITAQKAAQEHQTKLEQQTKETATRKETLLQKKGNLAAQAKKRTELEKVQKQQAKELTSTDAELFDLQTVAVALGKDGIQALLIEDAIPEIEQEANDLLARLTENQASIAIESLRDLKKGGTRETLDINISDAQGIRPYEMFSGGEAFRIDFALRIALSKLLARRAGTSLQTLIIDEGFGSQDQEGLSRIMDALYTIQDDFEKVIIVSHLAEMKEQFPVHFYIEKGPNGSTVNIIEQG